LIETSTEDSHSVSAKSIEGAFVLPRTITQGVRKKENFSILLITSSTSLTGMPNIITYSAAKSTIVRIIPSLANEFGSGERGLGRKQTYTLSGSITRHRILLLA
jgi:short-subunit dehydrogenase